MSTEAIGYLMKAQGKPIMGGAVRTFWFASFPFTTSGADTPAHQRFLNRITAPLDYPRYVFRDGATSGRTFAHPGNTDLENTDRTLNYLLSDYTFGGYPLVMYCGLRTGVLLSDFEVYFTGTTDHLENGNGTITFVSRGADDAIDTPIQPTTYLGNNVDGHGLEGNAELAGKEKPILNGTVARAFAVNVNPAKCIHEFHHGALAGWNELLDGGLALAFGGSYANTTELQDDALEPAAGYYKWCEGTGYFRLHEPAKSLVITNVAEGTTNADRTHAANMRKVWERCGKTSGDMLLADLATHAAQQPAECGVWIGSETKNAADVCDFFANSSGSGWGARAYDNKLRFVQLRKPEGDPVQQFTQFDSPKSEPLHLEPNIDANGGKPVWKVVVNFAHNYALQSASDLYDGASPEYRERAAQPFQTVSVSDASVLDTYPDAGVWTIDSAFVFEADALAEAHRVLQLRRVRRHLFTQTVNVTKRETLRRDLFDIIDCKYNAYNLDHAGVEPQIIFSVTPRSKSRQIVFTYWGTTATIRDRCTQDGADRFTQDHLPRVTQGL